MTIDQMLYFLETARFQHIGKAANSLSISRSAISHSISLLEEDLATKLFEKRGRNIFLTHEGKLLKKRAESLLAQVDTIKQELSGASAVVGGNYRIAGTHLLASKLLLPAWNKLQKENEKVFCEIYSLRSAEVLQAVARGDVDLGLCFAPHNTPEVDTRILYTGELNIYVKKSHPLAKTKSVKPEQLNRYGCSLPKAFQGIEVCEKHPMFNEFKIKPKVNLAYDSYDVGVERVLKSNDWGFFVDWLESVYPKKLSKISLGKGWKAPYNIAIITRAELPMPLALKKLCENLEGLL